MLDTLFHKDDYLKEILLIDESKFKQAGIFGKEVIDTLKKEDRWIKDGVLTLHTNTVFTINSPVMKILNLQLRSMKAKNIVSIKINLD